MPPPTGSFSKEVVKMMIDSVLNQTIISINEMIDYIDDFFGARHDNGPIIVGGMTGCKLQNIALDRALQQYDISQVLYVQGCQDYIDILNKRNLDERPTQYVFWADLFSDVLDEPLGGENPCHDVFCRPLQCYKSILRQDIINRYKVLIIQDAHLVPIHHLNELTKCFRGKIVQVIDPFDLETDPFVSSGIMKTITDTLEPVNAVKAFARALYGIDSQVNKKAKGVIKTVNIHRRSVGKIDDNQYITNDPALYAAAQSKQLQSEFHRNHRVLVTQSRIIRVNRDPDLYAPSITRNSMLTVMNIGTKPFMRLKLFASDIDFYNNISYLENPFDLHTISVKPANILSVKESIYHRYINAVIVSTDSNQLNLRERYSVVKNSANVYVGQI
jgi:hypothetical protein